MASGSTSKRTELSGNPTSHTIIFNSTRFSSMTCYFRHMKDIFAEIGVEPTKENKKELDRKIHGLLGVEYKNCSTTWKHVKEQLAENRDVFISELSAVLSN